MIYNDNVALNVCEEDRQITDKIPKAGNST